MIEAGTNDAFGAENGIDQFERTGITHFHLLPGILCGRR